MQGRFRRAALIASATGLLALGMSVTGAATVTAAPGDTCVVVAEPAIISSPSSAGGGLYYPVTDPNVASYPLSGPTFTWNLNGECANNGVSFSSNGTGVGWCGRSVGQGTGTMAGRSYTVSWQSVGSQLILTDPSAAGSVNAQANPPGSPNGSCLNGSATTFLVDGVIISAN